MNLSHRTSRRRLLAGLLPVVVVLSALPLLAPTCDGNQVGLKTFARKSLIIPMDVCYQYMTDGVQSSYTASSDCTQTPDRGNVIKAYGLVYQLIRNNIAVYWVIDPAKSSVTGVDLQVQYDGGFPVLRYDWASGGQGDSPVSGHVIRYLGGPFVVDGSDYDRASAVLQSYRSTFGDVKVHVASVAFQGNVAKTMAGGWNAGGTVPPKLALLDIGSSGAGAKNSEIVIQGYLTRAGLDTPGAAGTATGTHGQIYDRLLMADFLPDASGDWKTTNLYKNGYQILWVPHWAAPSSCSDCAAGTSCACTQKYSADTIAKALATIGAFSASGKDVFAECAGLGSFEGVLRNLGDTTTYHSAYSSGSPSTHFETTSPYGFWINKSVGGAAVLGNHSSPFLQLGDYPFIPLSGAIQNFSPNAYRAETVRLISDPASQSGHSFDIFTLVPRVDQGHGTVVYLGGHSYSGSDGPFEVGGSRLVLNTLFNLGASCVASGVACNTGLLGVCAQGVMGCNSAGQQVCLQIHTPSAELCDGLDNDCNGLVDDGLDQACYDGPAATRGKGICQDGVSSCVRKADGSHGMSACLRQVLPAEEVCNGLDDNCNDLIDENPASTSQQLSQACYTGPSDSLDPATSLPRGICKAGVQTCSAGIWSACQQCPDGAWSDRANPAYGSCEILPRAESCTADGAGNMVDMNCNGIVGDGCGCSVGASQSCYDGPPATAGVGACRKGTQTCQDGGSWSSCAGEVLPAKETCGNDVDDDCNGIIDDPAICVTCPATDDPSRICYVNADHSAPAGLCQNGVRSCADGVLGDCQGVILPSPEICDGKDNNCDGQADENPDALCAAGFTCVNGVCTPKTCGVEAPCPDGYACQANVCVVATCGTTGAQCPTGQKCYYGTCVDPCAGVTCGAGATCASGTCTGGGCYFTGCPAGLVCEKGACVADPCGSVACPAGTFCRQGDCVQACTFVTCGSGQKCGDDGFCVEDRCAGMTCSPGQLCVDGACVADPCLGKGCGAGQVCQGGTCVDDPCTGVSCPAGQCAAGQCFATGTAVPLPSGRKTKGGGCASGEGASAAALLLLLALPFARRRRDLVPEGHALRSRVDAAQAPPARPGARSSACPRARPLVVLLAAGVAALGTGCHKKSTYFDPSVCTAAGVVSCNESHCVDLTTDPGHCGRCDSTCATGQVCRDGVCGPGTAVAPYLTGVSPAQAPKGGEVTVTLTGQRFATGATVRLVSPTGSRTVDATLTDAAHLTALLDFTDSAATSLELRVVNPDHVISNALQFDVTLPSPVITAVTPPSVTVGGTASLAVTGTGFVASSQCHLKSAATTEQALPTTTASATSLTCTLDTRGVAPGSYELWVVNEGTLASNHLAFTVQSATPHIDAASPSSGQPGAVVAVTLIGSGFDVTSAVSFDGKVQATAFTDSSHVAVPQLQLPSVAGTYDLVVKNGALTSNVVTFTVSATVPVVTSLSVSPSPLFQGDSGQLTFTGTGLDTATGITVLPPSGTAPAATVTSAIATEVVGTVNLTGAVDGLYAARIDFPGGISSSSFQFRVLSSVAVLRSATPAGGAQGSTVNAVLTAANLRPGTGAVLFSGPGLDPARAIPVTIAAGAGSVAVGLELQGLDTGTYALAVQNPNAAASNAVSFSVTPGPPTVTTVSPACVVQSDTRVMIDVGGTNFALPDSTGAAVSQVMVSSDGTTWIPLPASAVVTVTSASAMRIDLNTLDAYVGPSGSTTYQVAVWNPPGPQRSNADQTLKVASACP